MQRLALLLAALLLLSWGSLAAQTIGGQLRDKESSMPIPGATVVLLDAEDAERGGVLTDSAGAFSIRAPAAGRYRLQVARIGYAAVVTDPISVGRRETLDLELLLATRAVPLSGVAVSVQAANRNRSLENRGFYDRQRKASGTFITRDAIEKRRSSDLIEIFRGVRGFKLQPNRRGPGYFLVGNRDTRGCLPLVFLDGVELRRLPGDRSDVIYAISPAHVEAIEAYASRMAVPPQFQRPDLNCGVVLVWTR